MDFTHHETVTASNAPEAPSTEGRWDIVENARGAFSVFSQQDGMYAGEETADIEGARKMAEGFASDYDASVPAPGFR